MIVLNITSLDQIEANKKDTVWYTRLPDGVGGFVAYTCVVDNHVVGYHLPTAPRPTEAEFLAKFPDAKLVAAMQHEPAIT